MMRTEKIEVEPIVNILDMTWKEYTILKVLMNNTGQERDDRIKENENMWGKLMDLEEALKLGCEVEDRVWAIRGSGETANE